VVGGLFRIFLLMQNFCGGRVLLCGVDRGD
jgi:hypothetical protein